LNKVTLNKLEILEFQQNKDPYLFVDYATEIIPGISAKGFKEFKKDEWFFKVHWPSDPNVPGMLQIESLVQMSSLALVTLPGLKNKIFYISSATDLKFSKKIVPESKLLMETYIKSFKRGVANIEGFGYLEKDLACKAKFTLILPDMIKSYTLKK